MRKQSQVELRLQMKCTPEYKQWKINRKLLESSKGNYIKAEAQLQEAEVTFFASDDLLNATPESKAWMKLLKEEREQNDDR